MHYKEISTWKDYLMAVKLKITTDSFLLDVANKMMHHICYSEARQILLPTAKPYHAVGTDLREFNFPLKIQRL